MNNKIIILGILLALALSGCIFSAEYNVSGIIVDSEGNGISGVEVFVSGDTSSAVTTDSQGKFSLAGLKGNVNLVVEKEGFIFSNPGAVTPKTKAIEITGVECEIALLGEGLVQATLNENGTVTFRAAPANNWTFIRWEGDLEGSVNPQSVEASELSSVTAVFYDFYTSEGYVKWAPELLGLSDFWASIFDREGLEFESVGPYLKVTMSPVYDYVGIHNVIIPSDAKQARVTVVDVSPGMEGGLWRLRMTQESGSTQNILGGMQPEAGFVELKPIPTASLSAIQAGDAITIDIGGNWTAGQWAIFKVDLLDENGDPVSFF